MKPMCPVLAWATAVLLAGCGGPYKKAVETYATTLQRRDATAYSCVIPELKKELILNDASLACLVDKDHSRAGTSSCKCSDGKPNDWEANCADWLAGR